jgi:hypothetical protein
VNDARAMLAMNPSTIDHHALVLHLTKLKALEAV